jgi:hypothetical protein
VVKLRAFLFGSTASDDSLPNAEVAYMQEKHIDKLRRSCSPCIVVQTITFVRPLCTYNISLLYVWNQPPPSCWEQRRELNALRCLRATILLHMGGSSN